MNADKLFNLLGSIVVLAMVTTLVLPKRETSNVIKSAGGAFSNAIATGMGKGM